MRQTRAAILITLAVVAAMQSASVIGLFQNFELQIFDTLRGWQAEFEPSGTPRTTIIWQTESEIVDLDWDYPMTDGQLAQVLEAVLRDSPAVLGVDLYRDKAEPPGTAELESLLTSDYRIVMVEVLAVGDDPPKLAPEYLYDEQIGFADMPKDVDGITRRIFLYLWDEAGVHVSLSLRLAQRYLETMGAREFLTAAAENPDDLALGGVWLPPLNETFGGYSALDADGYQIMLGRIGDLDLIPQYSISELLTGKVPPEMIKDRVVLVATAATSVKDAFLISGGSSIYGGQLHAVATEQLILTSIERRMPLGSWGAGAKLAWLACWTLVGVGLGFVIRHPLIVGATSIALVTTCGALSFVLLSNNVWTTTASPALSSFLGLGLAIAYCSREERIEKRQMMRLFGQFVSKEVVDEIWKERSVFMDGHLPKPARASVTVMQIDLSGFTAASRTLAPADVMNWIGQFMDEMASLVERYGGMVSDFTGDGLMANFGVPIVRVEPEEIANDARNAVRCSLAMGHSMEQINATWRAANLPTGRVRIGLCSGEVVSGAYGSSTHLKYATVGSVVNTAARIEGVDKESFDAEDSTFRVLVADTTWALLNGEFEGERQQAAILKGLDQPVQIYRINGEKNHA